MLKVASFDIVFQEIPGEVTLALNLSNCPCHCKGCHSPHLWEDIGEPLDEQLLDSLIDRYKGLITCVCFMGGDQSPEEVFRLARHVKSRPIGHSPSSSPSLSPDGLIGDSFASFASLRTAWYSGRSNFPPSPWERAGERCAPSLSPDSLAAERCTTSLSPDSLAAERCFDYVKLGPYIESLGGLKSPTTNQRLYKRVGDSWQDITSIFWQKRFD